MRNTNGVWWIERLFFKYSLYSLEIICPGRRGAILRLGAKSPLRPLVSSCFVLAAVLVSAEAVSDGSVSLETSGSSDISSWLVWAIGASVTLRRGNNGDLLDARGTGVLVVVLGCTCSLFRLRNLFRGLTVVERAGGGLVSAGAWNEHFAWKSRVRDNAIVERREIDAS